MDLCQQKKVVTKTYEMGNGYKTTCGCVATHRDEMDRSLCSKHFRNWYFRRHGVLPPEKEWWHYYLGGGDPNSYQNNVGNLPPGWKPGKAARRRRREEREGVTRSNLPS